MAPQRARKQLTSLSSQTLFPLNIGLNIWAYLGIALCQLSVWRFKPLPMMAVTSVYLSLPLSGMHNQRKCLTCFPFSSMRTDFLFGQSFQAIADSSCSYSCSRSQLFPHHLLQSWLYVQTHLILPSSIKKPFNDCTLNTVGPHSISLKKVVRSED